MGYNVAHNRTRTLSSSFLSIIIFLQNPAGLRNKEGQIEELRYDHYSKPLLPNGTDGDWEICNPNDPVTGLLYEPCSGGSNEAKQVPDWYDLVPKFIDHSFATALPGCSPADHPILMAERPYNPPATRQWTIECLFEELGAPAAFLAKDAVLACYGSGRTSSTVVDVGYSGCTVSPVFEGYVEARGIRRNPAASIFAMDEMILQHLDKLYYRRKKQKNMHHVVPLYQVRGHRTRKPLFHNAARLFVGQECRHAGAGASINTTAGTNFHAPSQPFELPDGTVLDVPSVDRFRAADLLYGKDPASQQARDAKFELLQTKLTEYIEAVPTVTESEDDVKQTAKEAVGILGTTSNRPKRGGGGGHRERSPKTKRSMAAWYRACNPHLQTLLDDQFTSASMANMICDSAYRCDRDQQATLLGNVVITGGGACLGPTEQAVPDYVKDSVESIIHQHTPGWRVKVLTPGLQERAVLPWIGGSILGSLSSFHEMWISKEDYEEWGSVIVNRKCP
jgi:actin-related protein